MNILVVGPSWVGDMVMAQSLFKALKYQDPSHNIDVIAPKWSLPILERMPEVRKGIGLDVQHGEGGLRKRYQLGKSLRGQYDKAIVLPRSLKSALVPFFAQIPIRTGFKGEMRYGLINDIRPLDKTILDQTVKRFTYLGLKQPEDVLDIHHPVLKIDRDNQDNVISALNLNRQKHTVGFMPGAEYGPAKQWPVEHFAALAKKIYDAQGQVWIFGSAKDAPVADEIISQAGGKGENLCGKTQLADAVDLLAYVDEAVTNDSGLMHVAASVETKIIALYGSSSPEYTPPLTDKADIHWLQLECSPCFQRQCPLGHYQCLTDIKADDVIHHIAIQK